MTDDTFHDIEGVALGFLLGADVTALFFAFWLLT